MFSQNLCIAEIAFLMRISSWNCTCAQSHALCTCMFEFEILTINVISIFGRLFWGACETLVKQPPFFYGAHWLTKATSSCLSHWGRDKMATKFADEIFKCIFSNENIWILIDISLKFVPKGQINNIPALVQSQWVKACDATSKRCQILVSTSCLCYSSILEHDAVACIESRCTIKAKFVADVWNHSHVALEELDLSWSNCKF